MKQDVLRGMELIVYKSLLNISLKMKKISKFKQNYEVNIYIE